MPTHVLPKNFGQHVPLKINVGLANVWQRNFFSGEDGLFQMKEFRTTLRYARKRMPKIKSSQVSPNARRRAQCKGGGMRRRKKKRYGHTNGCTTCRRLSENVVAAFTWNRNVGKSEAKHTIEPHFSQHFPSSPKICTR